MKGFLVWCLLCATAFAQITIPDKVEPYQPIIGGCNCIIPTNGKAQFMWRTDDKSKSVTSEPDGTKIYIWAPPGSHYCEVTVLTTISKKVLTLIVDPKDPNNKDKWKVEEVEVVDKFDIQRYEKNYMVGVSPVPGPDPPVPPGPGPGPGPTPVPPSDEFAAKVYTWLKAIPAASYSKDKANKIADNYTAVAAQAVATTGWNLDAFVNTTKTKNRDTLTPEETVAWSAPFFVPLAQEQAALFNARKLTTTDVAGLAQLWKDTAAAIKAATAATSMPGVKLNAPMTSENPFARKMSTVPYELSSLAPDQIKRLTGR